MGSFYTRQYFGHLAWSGTEGPGLVNVTVGMLGAARGSSERRILDVSAGGLSSDWSDTTHLLFALHTKNASPQ